MADDLALQIIDNVLTTLAAVTNIRTTDYDVPFDFELNENELPKYYVWDEADYYDAGGPPKALNRITAELSLIVVCQFTRDRTIGVRRDARAYRVATHAALMADVTRGGLAYLTWPVSYAPQDLNERKDGLAIAAMRWRISYFTAIKDATRKA